MFEKKFRCSQLARYVMNSTRLYSDDIQLMDCLMSLYEKFGENDLITALWKKRACLNGTTESFHLFNQGLYKEARIQVSKV